MTSLFKREIFSVVFNQTLLSIGSVFIVVLLARFTTEEVFGQLRYLIAMLTILSFWSLPGISLVINQQAAHLSRKELVALILTQFHWGILALGGALILSGYHMYRGDEELAQAFIVGAILTPVANLYLVPGIVLAGLKRFGGKALCDSLIIFSTLLGILIGVRYFDTPAEIVLVYYGVQSLVTLFGLSYVLALLPSRKKIKNIALLIARAEDGRMLTYLQIPFSLIPAIEKIVVFFVLGPTSLALFVVASLPVEHFKSAFRNLMQFYMLPHTNENDPSRLIHWFQTGVFLLMLGVMALVIFIFYGMPFLFESFDKAKSLALVLVVSVLPLPIHVITILWVAKRVTHNLAHFAVITVCANLLFVGIGAYVGGLSGAVFGKILYEITIAGGLVFIDRNTKTNYS